MREEEFDKILKNDINEQIKAPEKLKNRIRQEIKEFDNKKSKKTPLIKTMQGIAAVVVVGILSITSYAAVTGNLSLENLGLFKASKNYSQNAVAINQSIENKYIKFTLNNIACDDTYLITESTLNLTEAAIEDYGDIEYDSDYKQYLYPIEGSTYINNQKIISWGIDIQKTSDREYKILELYNISNVQDKDFSFKLDLENIILKDEHRSQNSEVSVLGNSSDDLFTPIQKVNIDKSISMDIQRKESNNSKFEEISQTVGNKTFVVKEAANTNFDTIIKASIITKENYNEYSKKNEDDSDYNSFMLTQGNGNDIAYQVSEDLNTYFILNDGNMISEDDLSEYIRGQEDIFTNVLTTGFNKDPQAMDYSEIVDKYGYDTDLKSKVVKVQKNYTIKIGNQEDGNDVKIIKLLPIKKDYINDRNDEETEYYKNATWYKLENKKYTATSELGGTLEITSIDITDDTITFNYNTKGLIGEDALILMRKNNGEFNYFYPEKTEIKGLNSNENKLTFSRTANYSAGTFGYGIKQKDIPTILNDISKDEFTMLFGKKNGTQFIGNGLIFDIPNKITDKITISNIEIKDLENTTPDYLNTGYNNTNDYDNSLFEAVETENTVYDETDSVEAKTELTLEQYNDLFNDAKTNIESTKTYGSQMDKNTASISGIKIGSTIDEVHNIMKEKTQETYAEKDFLVEYYSDDINVVYQIKNNHYYVTSISTRGRLETNTQIKIGDDFKKVIESYTKNNNLLQINKNAYNDGWVLYGNDDAVNLKNSEGYITNSTGGKNAYYLLNCYNPGGINQYYGVSSLVYFDDDVYMEYSIEDGKVYNIILALHEDTSEY